MKTQLSRRHFLRAAGSLIALPALESIGFRTFAAEKTVSRPKRMIFLGMGFGVTQETWFPDPTRVGAGGGAGVKMGHHLVVEKHTPLCNLWLTLLRGVGVDAERHGDSSGIIPQLVAS